MKIPSVVNDLPLSSEEENEETQSPPCPIRPRPPTPKLSKEEAARRTSAIVFIMNHLTEDLSTITTTTESSETKRPIIERSLSALAIRTYCYTRFEALFRDWVSRSRARQTRIRELHKELRDSEKGFSRGLLFIETHVVNVLRKEKILGVCSVVRALLHNIEKKNKPNDRYRKLLLFSDLGANFERHTNDLRNVLKESYQNRRLFRQDSSI